MIPFKRSVLNLIQGFLITISLPLYASADDGLEMTITHITSHPTIDQAQLWIGGTRLFSAAGDPSLSLTSWEQCSEVRLLVFPSLGSMNKLPAEGDNLSLISFLDSANSVQQTGNTVRASWNFGGRSITYDFTSVLGDDLFTLAELEQLDCV